MVDSTPVGTGAGKFAALVSIIHCIGGLEDHHVHVGTTVDFLCEIRTGHMRLRWIRLIQNVSQTRFPGFAYIHVICRDLWSVS
jgi:hypothetical protein